MAKPSPPSQAIIAERFQNHWLQQQARMPILSPRAVIPLLGALPKIPSGLRDQRTFPDIGRSEWSKRYLG
ncbi:MAG: hypothetical protein DMG41_38595 [Acidobacteria bacterium]|nr:MAG: hypothetical protein DMG41_38595 [Acidobacteriota bacterium]